MASNWKNPAINSSRLNVTDNKSIAQGKTLVYSIPAEIWKIIFHDATSDIRELLQPSCPPMSLGHVCHLWRDIVYSTPVLWATLKSPTFNIERNAIPKFKAHFQTIVEASRPLPLTFSINIVDGSTFKNIELAQQCLQMLCEESYRWKAIFIDSKSFAMLPDYLHDRPLPFLEHVGIIGISLASINVQRSSYKLLKSAPRLFSVECHDFCDRIDRVLDPRLLELPHLRHYSAGSSIEHLRQDGLFRLGMESLFNHLLRCTELVSLDLWFPGIDSEDVGLGSVPLHQPCVLLRLQAFSAKFLTFDALEIVLCSLSCPNLQTLTLATTYRDASDNWESLIPFTSTCSSRLEHISLPFTRVHDPSVQCILYSMPRLRSLELCDIMWNQRSWIFSWLKRLIIHRNVVGQCTFLSGEYLKISRLSLQTVQRDDDIKRRWDKLRHTACPLEGDGRFCSRIQFKAGMAVLQDVIKTRWHCASEVAQAFSCLESFSIDNDCLFAMMECAPDCYSFLQQRWAEGLKGRPSLAPKERRRQLPGTWASLHTVPRFFREEGDEIDEFREDSDEENLVVGSVPVQE